MESARGRRRGRLSRADVEHVSVVGADVLQQRPPRAAPRGMPAPEAVLQRRCQAAQEEAVDGEGGGGK